MTRLIVVVSLLFAAAVSGRMMPMAQASVAMVACPHHGQSGCRAHHPGHARPMRPAVCHAATCAGPVALPILPTANPAPAFTPARYAPGLPSRGAGLTVIPDAPPPRAGALN